jgi:UDPglucose 6-dehydrogenase
MNLTLAGTGYVGLGNAILLARHNWVTALDIVPERVAMINARRSPVADAEIGRYLVRDDLNLNADHGTTEAITTRRVIT